MRVVSVIHPNEVIRTFTCDQKITDESIGYLYEKVSLNPKINTLYEELTEINLVTQVDINKYEVSITIVEAFADSNIDWLTVSDSVVLCIAKYFDMNTDLIKFSTKDTSNKYKNNN